MRSFQQRIDLRDGCTLYVEKPLRWSSFALVNKVRYEASQYTGIRKIKVGHAGTLDPLASGVMILCTGRHTKLIDSLQQGCKEYIAEITFGQTTPTFDLESAPDASYPTEHLTEDLVRSVLPLFTGQIEQTPPIFSACKIDGRRAYDLARQGASVALKSKTITIHEIELLACQLPVIRLRILCGKGTYIRALARDLGSALGSGAHLTALQRTRVGEAYLDNCITIDELPDWLEQHALKIEEIEPSQQ